MKRFRTSLTALAVTSALALGVFPAAHAEEYNWDLGQPPATVSVAGVDYDYKDGQYVERGGTKTMTVDEAKAATSNPTPYAESEAPAPSGEVIETQGEKLIKNPNGEGYVRQDDPTGRVFTQAEVDKMKELDASNAQYEKDAAAINPETYTTLDGTVFYRHKDGKSWVDVKERAAGELNELEIARSEEIAKLIAADQDKRKVVAGVGTALAAAIVIGGVTWYLNQDGKTYVPSKDRVNAQPTDAEKQASEQMLKNNAEAVKAQSQAPQGAAQNQERGMLAHTGSNTVARTLFALLVLSILGTAAFFARRKFA